MTTTKNATVTASPSLVLARASSTSVITEWTLDAVLKAPAKFCKDLLHAMRNWKGSRMMPEQAMRDARKAAGIYLRTPNASTERAYEQAKARLRTAENQYQSAIELLVRIPNLNGITIGKIQDVDTSRELTARDLADGLTLPPSQSEIARWLSDGE